MPQTEKDLIHAAPQGWLILIYTVPAKPVNNRMKIWRQLNKAGALRFKGTAYLLPNSRENYAFLKRLSDEVSGLGGEAAFMKTDRVENMADRDVVNMFNRNRETEYKSVVRSLQKLGRKVKSVEKGGSLHDEGQLRVQLNRCLRQYRQIKKKDFFGANAGHTLRDRIGNLQIRIETIISEDERLPPQTLQTRKIDDYKGKTWVTLPDPYVDRMATAWLVRRFIDSNAEFDFASEEDWDRLGKGDTVSFDMRNGEVTHLGDKCTFEVLLNTLNLREMRLKKIARIVHALDMQDNKYSPAEAKGLEDILAGIRKSTTDDREALEKGMSIFEMLYTALG